MLRKGWKSSFKKLLEQHNHVKHGKIRQTLVVGRQQPRMKRGNFLALAHVNAPALRMHCWPDNQSPFHEPCCLCRGARLATSSGDGTVKIWDFSKAECVLTFTDHTHAVWGCSWHSCGDFLASCSMDNTSKVWDVNR